MNFHLYNTYHITRRCTASGPDDDDWLQQVFVNLILFSHLVNCDGPKFNHVPSQISSL